MEAKWNEQIRKKIELNASTSLMPHHAPSRAPFIFHIELARGIFRILDVFIHYMLMLIAMTFNVGLFLAVIVGAGVGTKSKENYSLTGLILFSVFRPVSKGPQFKGVVGDADSGDCH